MGPFGNCSASFFGIPRPPQFEPLGCRRSRGPPNLSSSVPRALHLAACVARTRPLSRRWWSKHCESSGAGRRRETGGSGLKMGEGSQKIEDFIHILPSKQPEKGYWVHVRTRDLREKEPGKSDLGGCFKSGRQNMMFLGFPFEATQTQVRMANVRHVAWLLMI